MKLNSGVCALPFSLLTLSFYANTENSLEHIEVLGTCADGAGVASTFFIGFCLSIFGV